MTTLIGQADDGVQFAPSAPASFRKPIAVDILALHTPPLSAAAPGAAGADADRDRGCLYVACEEGLFAFNLTAGTGVRYRTDPGRRSAVCRRAAVGGRTRHAHRRRHHSAWHRRLWLGGCERLCDRRSDAIAGDL
jgi:hypothetical protein